MGKWTRRAGYYGLYRLATRKPNTRGNSSSSLGCLILLAALGAISAIAIYGRNAPYIGVGVLAAIVLGWWLTRKRQTTVDPALIEIWDNMVWQAQFPGHSLIIVNTVYQRARTGTKAHVTNYFTGTTTDSWFDDVGASPGAAYLIRDNSCSIGYGPHHSRDVLYIRRDAIDSWVTQNVRIAAEHRHR